MQAVRSRLPFFVVVFVKYTDSCLRFRLYLFFYLSDFLATWQRGRLPAHLHCIVSTLWILYDHVALKTNDRAGIYLISNMYIVCRVMNKESERNRFRFAPQSLYYYTDMGPGQCLQVTPSSLKYSISKPHRYYTETNQKRHLMQKPLCASFWHSSDLKQPQHKPTFQKKKKP